MHTYQFYPAKLVSLGFEETREKTLTGGGVNGSCPQDSVDKKGLFPRIFLGVARFLLY